MFKKLTVAAILLISIASCKSKDALNYNEDFVKKETSLMKDITGTEDKVRRYVEAEQFDSIAIVGEKMEQLVDVKIQEIKKAPVPDVNDVENFKEACLKYFGYVKNMYSRYKEFGLAPTATEREEVMNKIIALAANKQSTMDAIQMAQKKFADANGFKLQKQ